MAAVCYHYSLYSNKAYILMYETIHYIITILLNLALIILQSKCIFMNLN